MKQATANRRAKCTLKHAAIVTLALLLSGCFLTAPSSHNLVAPGSLKPGEEAATIGVPVNVEVMIIEIDGRPGPNPHQIDRFPSVYNNTFTQAASVAVTPGPHDIRIACRYQPGTFAKAKYRVRVVSLNLQPGEVMSLFAPEQEKARDAGLILPRSSTCPIRVKSSLRGERILPDPGN